MWLFLLICLLMILRIQSRDENFKIPFLARLLEMAEFEHFLLVVCSNVTLYLASFRDIIAFTVYVEITGKLHFPIHV